MTPSLDDLMGAALDLVKALRAGGRPEEAAAILAALSGGCSAPELVQSLRAELLGLADDLPEAALGQVRDLLTQLTAWLEAEGY